jgi:hypothetical protein
MNRTLDPYGESLTHILTATMPSATCFFHFCYRTHVCAARGREYWARIGFELRYFRRGRPPLMGRQLIDEPICKFRPNSIDASLKLVS